MVRSTTVGSEWWHQRLRNYISTTYESSPRLQTVVPMLWNVTDWSIVGTQLIGKGLWVVVATAVIFWFPMRRVIETEQMRLEYEAAAAAQQHHSQERGY